LDAAHPGIPFFDWPHQSELSFILKVHISSWHKTNQPRWSLDVVDRSKAEVALRRLPRQLLTQLQHSAVDDWRAVNQHFPLA
jgi:hypothetical protein